MQFSGLRLTLMVLKSILTIFPRYEYFGEMDRMNFSTIKINLKPFKVVFDSNLNFAFYLKLTEPLLRTS